MSRRFSRTLHLALLVVALFSGAVHAQANLDPMLRFLVMEADRAEIMPEQFSALVPLDWERPELEPRSAWGTARTRVLVEIRGAAAVEDLPGLSGVQNHGSVITAWADILRLQELAAHPMVVYVEASRPLHPTLDASLPEIRAPAAWHGEHATRGEGVIVGVVDTGIDYLHRDFRVDGDGSETRSRILYIWDQEGFGSGPGGAPLQVPYGRLYDKRELETYITMGSGPRLDTHGHGTHVAGIAAGDGSAGDGAFIGVAPAADIVAVRTTFYTDTVLDGVRFVFNLADHLGQPAVVNLSLGGHAGPHDGTSLFERAIDDLLDVPGRAVVVAAGNEGDRRIHIGQNVQSPVSWQVDIASGSVPMEFWHVPQAAFRVIMRSPGGDEVSAEPGMQKNVPTPHGSVYLFNSLHPDPRNGDKRVFALLSGTRPGDTWTIRFEPAPSGGQIDGWITNSSAGTFRQGNTSSTISEPGNARRVITVGAYITKTEWDSLDGRQTATGYRVGALAPFSSQGPTRDGRPKPDVAAPGAWIAAPLSRDASMQRRLQLPEGSYAVLQGTSMSAPHVAGLCALMLAISPELMWDELLLALQEGSRSDIQTGTTPNVRWGAGKVDAVAALDLIPKEPPPPPTPPPTVPKLTLDELRVREVARFLYHLPEGVHQAELHIYDLSGRRIVRRQITEPRGELTWDLRTDTGLAVGSGVYLATIISGPSRSDIVRLVVQR